MENLSERYNELTLNSDVSDFGTLPELKKFHVTVNESAEELSQDADNASESLRAHLDELNETSGFGTKYLGGLFGDKEKATDLKNTKSELEEAQILVNNVDEWSQQLTDSVFEQAIDIIACVDAEFVTLVEHRNLMAEALEFTEAVLTEVNEAIEALNEAEDAEEWDQWSSDGFSDMNSDFANQDAADEVADVTRILVDYRNFLHTIGENDAAHLEGADFDFDWGDMLNESFFGDFWGSEMMLDKINRAQNDMVDLHSKISQLYDSFGADYNQVSDLVNSRVDEEWEAA